ncbi:MULTISPECIES: PotD/PotF family extracellular solute-binding protein [unclassified Gemella]|uniref:ABC transporter substrate-binding protein n=1 Tax=unclassified Gemella TaxID=2624949 RepID=UPI001C059883|nr:MULTISPECIES: ABC transporter substrate-binding protein [unclassified Gemella]MBU0278821.1 ABC transporter substrate-binding protein [Gemella sp. zg-1178]QWQ39371.1 ABC transporter substrate-binding protein [Gemella sp. zg-570]
MKKLVVSAISIILLCIGLLESRTYIDSSQAGSQNTLTIFNWGEYISPDLLKKFTEETGIEVIYETFDSNEALLTKLKSGSTSYDLVVPSDYMIKKMIDFNLLQEIDKSKLTNFNKINPELLNKSFDMNNKYSIPYFWGTLGIIYNPDLLDKDQKFEKWDDLWDERLKNEVILIDGAREMLGLSLQSQGESVNETDEIKLKLAEKKLELMGANIKAINNDEKTMLMVNEDAKVAITYSGSAAQMIAENEKLVYSVPKEGSNIWFDNMVIPKVAKNVEAAHKFIDFILRPENAAKNAEFVGYATPILDAYEILGEEITSDEQFYPSEETMNHLEVYDAQSQKIVQMQNDLFLEFKININRP